MQQPGAEAHPRLAALIERARSLAARPGAGGFVVGLVHPCDALALAAAQHIAASGFAQPLLIGNPDTIAAAARAAGVDPGSIELHAAPGDARAAAQRAVELVHAGRVHALMKGSLHTDELMGAIVARSNAMRTHTRISHAFVFDLPRYHKLLTLTDCVINIAPHLPAKSDILTNALALLRALGVAEPKVGIVAAIETVNPAIAATVDAQALVEEARNGAWSGAIVEGPFGFDNAISAEAARIKRIDGRVSGEADLLLMPDLNAGNMLYKSFNYIGGGDCAGLVLGAKVPIVLTSRADSALSRIASVALARLAGAAHAA